MICDEPEIAQFNVNCKTTETGQSDMFLFALYRLVSFKFKILYK